MKTRKPRKYAHLPKKYAKMLRENPSPRCKDSVFSALSTAVEKDGYIYYIYMSCTSGDFDRVYRFAKEEHEHLMDLITHDCWDDNALDLGWILDCETPYIVTEPTF